MANFSITKNVAVHMPLEACKDCIYCDPSIEYGNVAGFDEEVDGGRSIVCSHEFACVHAHNSAKEEERW